MLLFSPMWLHEVERIGFARCSRTSALLRAGSDCCTLAAIALLMPLRRRRLRMVYRRRLALRAESFTQFPNPSP